MMLDKCLAFLDYLLCSITTRVEDCKAIDHGIVASMVDVQLKDNLWSYSTYMIPEGSMTV